VGLSYGVGTSHWRSSTDNYTFLDHRGLVLSEGDVQLRAQNANRSLRLETLVPVHEGAFRLGLGIAFEEYQLSKIEFQSDQGDDTKAFVETFRFDKFFVQGEVPLKLFKADWLGVAVQANAGWYGFTDVNSMSLFGPKRKGKRWFAGCAAVVDFKVHDVVYLVVMPNVEYKYFFNNRDLIPGRISHNLFDYNLNIGVRVHVL